MTDLNALIFDVDGTLAETERDGHRIAFNAAFAESGLDWHWEPELYGELLKIAGGKERIRFFIEHYDPPLAPLADLDSLIVELHQAKTAHYTQWIQEGKIPPRPGVVRLIQEAREVGMRLAIATTSALDTTITLLQTLLAPDSPDWFEVIAAGDIVAAKKPAPDIYHYVLQHMRLDPSVCLVFEDSAQGLRAATQAGLPTVITANGYTLNHDFSGAILVLNHLGEPDNPLEAIAGTVYPLEHPASYVDLAFARWLHQQAIAP